MSSSDYIFNKITKAVEEGTNNAVSKVASTLEKEAKKLAPVDSGKLRNSIYTNVNKPEYLAEVKSNVFYAKYVINGTIYQEPNDFPEEADDNQDNNIDKIIKSEIKKAISKL